MARKVLVRLVDDLDGSPSADVAPVTFALDGVTYQIDLNQRNASRLRDSLAAFVASARRTSGRAKRGTAIKAGRGSGGNDVSAIREWAKEQGYPVSARGRIPGNILDAYNSAGGAAAAEAAPKATRTARTSRTKTAAAAKSAPTATAKRGRPASKPTAAKAAPKTTKAAAAKTAKSAAAAKSAAGKASATRTTGRTTRTAAKSTTAKSAGTKASTAKASRTTTRTAKAATPAPRRAVARKAKS